MKISSTNPGGAAFGPTQIDEMLAPDQMRVDNVRQRRERVEKELNEYQSLDGLMTGLDSAVKGIKYKSDFTNLSLTSSHPEILEGIANSDAALGTYEMEIQGLARQSRHLEMGFPDQNETPVGFGYVGVQVGEGDFQNLTVPPGSTLDDVVGIINNQGNGVKAMVVNTGISEDPLRLLVSSEATGENARVEFDADTTFLHMEELKTASNLKARFEDVDVQSETNKLGKLLPGVELMAKQGAPGQKVQVSVAHDVEATIEGVKSFVQAYNGVSEFAQKAAAKENPLNLTASSRSDVRSVMRQIQSEVYSGGTQQFPNMAAVGIQTNAKTGALEVDEAKLNAALSSNYDGVADLFVSGENGEGVAGRLANAIQRLRDPQSGAVKSRIRGLNQQIAQQDRVIEASERRIEDRRDAMKQKFSRASARINELEGQGQFLEQRFGNNTSAS